MKRRNGRRERRVCAWGGVGCQLMVRSAFPAPNMAHINFNAPLFIGANRCIGHGNLKKDLRLELIGEEEETSRKVYKLDALLSADLMLPLKAHGYVNERVRLWVGEVIDSAWVK